MRNPPPMMIAATGEVDVIWHVAALEVVGPHDTGVASAIILKAASALPGWDWLGWSWTCLHVATGHHRGAFSAQIVGPVRAGGYPTGGYVVGCARTTRRAVQSSSRLRGSPVCGALTL
jgi:hypothetical protein